MAWRLWPAILVPSAEEWNPNTSPSLSSGRSLTNREQVAVGPTGYVTASLTVPCKTPDKVRAMRALIAGLDGRAGIVVVGPNETDRAPWFRDPLTGGAVTYAVGERDRQISGDFHNNPDTSSVLDIRLAAPASLNGTLLNVRVNRAGELLPGMMFSLGTGDDARLHVVTDVVPPTAGGADAIGLRIRPWLRRDYPDVNAVLEFGRPICAMRLARDDTGRMLLDLARYATVTLDLVEA